MSGGPKGAKRLLERPLDRRVGPRPGWRECCAHLQMVARDRPAPQGLLRGRERLTLVDPAEHCLTEPEVQAQTVLALFRAWPAIRWPPKDGQPGVPCVLAEPTPRPRPCVAKRSQSNKVFGLFPHEATRR